MSNALAAGIYLPFALITAVILVLELSRRFKRREDRLFMLLCLFTVCWFASKIAEILAGNEETVKFFIQFCLIFVGFIPPVLLLFILKFYKTSYQPTARVLALLFAIPSVNTILAITANHHAWMTTHLDIVSLSPVREVVLVWGPWFWIHTAYCYVVSVTLISVILIRHFRMPKFYRVPSTLMVAGVSFTLLGNVAALLQLLPQALDPTLIAISLSLIFFDVAIINNNNSKFVRFSYEQIFHYLDEYILILDEAHRVVDANRPAQTWFSARGIPLNGSTLENIAQTFSRRESPGRSGIVEKEKSVDYYISDDAFPVVLSLRTQVLTDANGDVIGSIAVFSDVTQNRMLLQQLEAKAGMDPLTGLANRTAYAGALLRLDTPEHLPLSVIVCDANGLKIINDTLGHPYGDMLLRVLGGVLEKACPKLGVVARMGGDEFVYLLPRTGPEASCALIEHVKADLSNLDNLPFAVSAAFGTATKHSAEESFDSLLALADSRMYEDKKRMKAQNDHSLGGT